MRLISALIVSATFAAPVPKDMPAPGITPGDWKTSWSGCGWWYNLAEDGTCTGRQAEDREPSYRGYWSWDAKTRRLSLVESSDGWRTWAWYLFEVDKDLRGRCIESAFTGEVDAVPRAVVWSFTSRQ